MTMEGKKKKKNLYGRLVLLEMGQESHMKTLGLCKPTRNPPKL